MYNVNVEITNCTCTYCLNHVCVLSKDFKKYWEIGSSFVCLVVQCFQPRITQNVSSYSGVLGFKQTCASITAGKVLNVYVLYNIYSSINIFG